MKLGLSPGAGRHSRERNPPKRQILVHEFLSRNWPFWCQTRGVEGFGPEKGRTIRAWFPYIYVCIYIYTEGARSPEEYIYIYLGEVVPQKPDFFIFAHFNFGCFRPWQPLPQVGVMKTVCFGGVKSHGIATSILGAASCFSAFGRMPPNSLFCSLFLAPPTGGNLTLGPKARDRTAMGIQAL